MKEKKKRAVFPRLQSVFWLNNKKKGWLTATTCQSLKVIPTHNFILLQTLNMAKSFHVPHVQTDEGREQDTNRLFLLLGSPWQTHLCLRWGVERAKPLWIHLTAEEDTSHIDFIPTYNFQGWSTLRGSILRPRQKRLHTPSIS